MIIIGVDPGFSGALCAMTDSGKVLDLIDMPVIKADKVELDETAIKQFLINSPLDAMVFIEKVNAMPKQGVVSMFRFGTTWGILRGICVGLGMRYTLVTPQRWKGSLMDGMGKDKGESIVRAKQLFPSLNLPRKKDHGKAEAVLIAEFGRRQLVGKA